MGLKKGFTSTVFSVDLIELQSHYAFLLDIGMLLKNSPLEIEKNVLVF